MNDPAPIFTDLGIDISSFTQGMLQASSLARLFPDVILNYMANPLLGLIGTFETVTSALSHMVESTAQTFHQLGIEATNAGVSVQFLSQQNAAFEAAGAGANAFGDAMKFLSRNAYEALHGNAQLAQSFAAIHVSLNEIRSLQPAELFQRFEDGIKSLPDHYSQVALSMQLAGRSAEGMLFAFLNSGGTLAEFTRLADQLGATVSDSMAKAGNKVYGLQSVFSLAMQGIQNAASKPILQYLADHSQAIQKVIVQVSIGIQNAMGIAFAFISSHGAAITAFASLVGTQMGNAYHYVADNWDKIKTSIGVATGKIGDGFKFIGDMAIKGAAVASSAWHGLGDTLGFVQTHTEGLSAAFVGLGAAYIAMKVPMMRTEVAALGVALRSVDWELVLIAGGIGLAVGAVVYFHKGIADLAGYVAGHFMVVWDAVLAKIQNVFHYVEVVSHAIGSVMSGLNHAVGAANAFSSQIASEAINVTHDVLHGVAGGAQSLGFAGSAQSAQGARGNVTIQNVNVGAPLDARDTAHELAAKIQPAIAAAQRRTRDMAHAAASAAAVKAGA